MKLPLGLRRVEGESMMPRLLPGNVIIMTRWYLPPKEGDIVVIRHNGLEKVKRVTKVSEKRIFVSGDNRLKSTDSDEFGWLELTAVVGKLLWPRS